MNLYNFRTFLALLTPILLVVSFAYWNLIEQKEPKFSFIVKIQKEFREDFSLEEVIEYIHEGNPDPKNSKNPAMMWNIDTSPLLIAVTIQNDGQIKLNREIIGNFSNTQPLIVRLNEILVSRDKHKIYEKETSQIVKKVIIKSNRSISYGNVVKVIDAVKSAGAEPIVLQIDDLPN